MNRSQTDFVAMEDEHSTGVYAKRPVVFVHGRGASLWDHDGREYIDCASGHGVANLGHAHPALQKAISEQAGRLITCQETYYNDRRARYMSELVALAPGFSRVFLCNSGTEAIEAALKYARQATGRAEVVAAMRGFHGRTLGSLSATWNKRYRRPFEPLVPGFRHVPYNNLEALEEALGTGTAAVLLEIVQGEGGVHIGEPGYLHAAGRMCRENGSLLIVDEVQTGFGRTGRMFAYQHHDLEPDLICLAKSMAGGLPAGAVLFGSHLKTWSTGMHGSTFGGNPLVCAAGLATISVLEAEELLPRAAELGRGLMDNLSAIDSPVVREVRGLGLMLGIELKRKVAPYLERMLQQGVVALPAGMTVLRLLPPLVIREDQLSRVTEVIAAVLAEEV